MAFIEFVVDVKQIFEAVTTIATASILITGLFKRLPGLKMKIISFFVVL
jgi:hypothetical protein